jgi:hypothetical protein
MATRPNEIVSEAMERALPGGMDEKYSFMTPASTARLSGAVLQALESLQSSSPVSDKPDVNLAYCADTARPRLMPTAGVRQATERRTFFATHPSMCHIIRVTPEDAWFHSNSS